MVSNTLAPQPQAQNPAKAFTAFLTSDAVKNKINQILKGKEGTKFIADLVTVVTNNPTLQKCDKATILASALLGASLKLSASPQLGQYHLVPYNDNDRGITVAQFQLGYKGYIQLAMRSGYYADLDVIEVREGEYKGKNKLTGKAVIEFIEDDELRESLPIVGYYSYFELLNGFKKSLYWSKVKMENHAKTYSKAYAKDLKKGSKWSFWSKDFDGMAFKTMLRQLISKWGIMSIEFQTALDNDMAVLNDVGEEPQYVDNATDEIIEVQASKNDDIAQHFEDEEHIINNDPFAFD